MAGDIPEQAAYKIFSIERRVVWPTL